MTGGVDFSGFLAAVGAVDEEADEGCAGDGGLAADVDLADAAEPDDAVGEAEEGFFGAAGESRAGLDADDSPFVKRDTIDRKNFFTSHSAGRHRGSGTEAQ